MTKTATNKLAIEALRKMRQGIIFDANVQKFFGVDTSYAIKCLERVKKIDEAIADLEAGDGWVQETIDSLLGPIESEEEDDDDTVANG